MNDFLQSIRNGNYSKDNRQRYNQQKPRRNYDNQNGNFNRSNGNERKFRHKSDAPANDETLKAIKNALETIAINQTSSMEIAARRADAEERKAAAFEFIAASMGNFSPEQVAPKLETVETIVKAEAEKAAGTQEVETSESLPTKSYEIFKNSNRDLNKDEILSMILSMRNDGSTYNEIASHLVSLDLPTFSGRGKWHAQTIHRLCQSI